MSISRFCSEFEDDGLPLYLDPIHQGLKNSFLSMRTSIPGQVFGQGSRVLNDHLPLIHIGDGLFDHPEDVSGIPQEAHQPVFDQALQVTSRQAPSAFAALVFRALDQRLADIIPIARAFLVGMGRHQTFALIVINQPGQPSLTLRSCRGCVPL